jgi:hypothetical protein
MRKIEVFTNVHTIVKDKLTNLGRYIWKKCSGVAVDITDVIIEYGKLYGYFTSSDQEQVREASGERHIDGR